MIKYTLAFACSSDGFIAKYSGDNPFEWTSLEDKKHLDNLIKNHKWQVMGRKTHELNPNESRSRIIFSRKYQKIKQIKNSINQYFFNPDINQWDEFENLCKESVLILGGTSVHDYFLYADLIDEIFITVEPLKFGKGLPAFTYINFRDLVPYLNERGYRHSEKKINDKGSLLVNFSKT